MTSFLIPASSIDIGAKPFDNVYQGPTNMLEGISRVLNTTAVKQGLQNTSIGTDSTQNLPQGVLLKATLLVLTIKAADLNKAKGGYLPEAWGYRMVDDYEFQMGDSQMLRIKGDSNFLKVMADCETKSKRDELRKLGGEQLNITSDTNNVDAVAYIAVYLPFSNVNSSRCTPYDSSILNGPVSLTIRTRAMNKVMSKNKAATIVYPSVFGQAYIEQQTAIFADGPQDSIRDLVNTVGSPYKYTYAYIYPQYFTSVIDSSAPSTGQKVIVRLDQFKNGSVQSSDFWLTIESFKLSTVTKNLSSGADSAWNPHLFLQMSDVELLYGSNKIYRSDLQSNDFFDLTEYPVPASFDTQLVKYDEAANPTATSATSKWCHVQLAQYNERFFTNYAQTGPTLVNNSVQMEFYTPENDEIAGLLGLGVGVVTDVKLRLHANYNMQAAVRTANARTELIFVPPVVALQPIRASLEQAA